MKLCKLIMIGVLTAAISPVTYASFNLNVKIGQLVGSQVIEVTKTIQADYNKEITISADGLKNKIILNLKKFSNVLANGNKIAPVQVDMKLVNEMEKIIGRPQTVTSFYNHSAQFAISSSGVPSDVADINVSLNFDEQTN